MDDQYEYSHACEDCHVELPAYDVAHGYEVCEECGEERARWASAELDRILAADVAGRVIA